MSRKSQTADLIALIENLKDEVHSLKEQIKTLEEESLLRNKNQKKKQKYHKKHKLIMNDRYYLVLLMVNSVKIN